jgi:hypothetical protein
MTFFSCVVSRALFVFQEHTQQGVERENGNVVPNFSEHFLLNNHRPTYKNAVYEKIGYLNVTKNSPGVLS